MSDNILKDAFSGWMEGYGMFYYLHHEGNMPWREAEYDDLTLDVAYFANHSGAKLCSPLVNSFISSDGSLPPAARAIIAGVIAAKYLYNWNRLWQTNIVDYSPEKNYDVLVERSMIRDSTTEEGSSGTMQKTGTDTVEHGLTQTTTHGKTQTVTHGLVETTEHGKTESGIGSTWAFNSSNPVDTDKLQNTQGGSTTVENTGDDVERQSGTTGVANTGNDVNRKNLTDTSTSSKESSGSLEEEETVRRSGNNGIYTNQRLIKEERELWLWNFFEQVFKDLDRELALSVYDVSRV